MEMWDIVLKCLHHGGFSVIKPVLEDLKIKWQLIDEEKFRLICDIETYDIFEMELADRSIAYHFLIWSLKTI